jgi:hypothetical protein
MDEGTLNSGLCSTFTVEITSFVALYIRSLAYCKWRTLTESETPGSGVPSLGRLLEMAGWPRTIRREQTGKSMIHCLSDERSMITRGYVRNTVYYSSLTIEKREFTEC